jgi:hypothetical protein
MKDSVTMRLLTQCIVFFISLCLISCSSKAKVPRFQIEYPEIVILPSGITGQQIHFPFTIRNSGTEVLQLGRMSSHCACTSSPYPDNVDLLVLHPGEEYAGKIRVSLNAKPGLKLTNTVEFTTNIPGLPIARITAVVERVCGVSVSHGEFSRYIVGSGVISGEIVLRFTGVHLPAIDRIQLSDTSGFELALLDQQEEHNKLTLAYRMQGTIGQKRNVNSTLRIVGTDFDQILQTPFTFEFRQPIRALPAEIILPRVGTL